VRVNAGQYRRMAVVKGPQHQHAGDLFHLWQRLQLRENPGINLGKVLREFDQREGAGLDALLYYQIGTGGIEGVLDR